MSGQNLEKDPEVLDPKKLVDQLVVNGELNDGARVSLESLGIVALGSAYHKDKEARFRAILKGVLEDDRFIGGNAEEGFSFRPDLTPDSTVKASWLSIIEGRGRFKGDEELRVLQAMKVYTDVVYANYKEIWTLDSGVVPVSELRGLLRMSQALLVESDMRVTDMRFKAFRRFIGFSTNSWFTELPDERVVLLQTGKRAEDVTLLQPIVDIRDAIRQAVEAIGPNKPKSGHGPRLGAQQAAAGFAGSNGRRRALYWRRCANGLFTPARANARHDRKSVVELYCA